MPHPYINTVAFLVSNNQVFSCCHWPWEPWESTPVPKEFYKQLQSHPLVCECVVINESVFVRYGICIIATPHMPSSTLVTHEKSNNLPSTSFAVLTNLWHLWSEWIICFHTWHQSGDELAQYNTISEALCKVWYIPARKLPGENPDPL